MSEDLCQPSSGSGIRGLSASFPASGILAVFCLAGLCLLGPQVLTAESFGFMLVPPELRSTSSMPGTEERSKSERTGIYALEPGGTVTRFRLIPSGKDRTGGIACKTIFKPSGESARPGFVHESEVILEGTQGFSWKALFPLGQADGSSRFLALGMDDANHILIMVYWDREKKVWNWQDLDSLRRNMVENQDAIDSVWSIEAAGTGGASFVWVLEYPGGRRTGIWRSGKASLFQAKDTGGQKPVKVRIFFLDQDAESGTKDFALAIQDESSLELEIWQAGPGPQDKVKRTFIKPYNLALTAFMPEVLTGDKPLLLLGEDYFLDLRGHQVQRPAGLPARLLEEIKILAGLASATDFEVPVIRMFPDACPWSGSLILGKTFYVWRQPETGSKAGTWLHSLGNGIRCLGWGSGGVWVLRLQGLESLIAGKAEDGEAAREIPLSDDLVQAVLRARTGGVSTWQPLPGDLAPDLALRLRFPVEWDASGKVFLIPELDLVGVHHEE